MDEILGYPTDNHKSRVFSVEEALDQLLAIQDNMMAWFIERRGQRGNHEPTRMQIFVLSTVASHQPMTVSQLADILRVTPPTASQIVTTLLDHGWLTMALSSVDRRRHEISLTTAGDCALKERTQKRLVRVAKVLERLEPEERGELIALLNHISAAWQSIEGEGGATHDQ